MPRNKGGDGGAIRPLGRSADRQRRGLPRHVEDFVVRQCRPLPCQGTLTIDATGNGGLMGCWETLFGTYVLRGKVGYDQNSWSGQVEKPNDQTNFPIKEQFLLMTRESGKITGVYQPRGTAIGFPVTSTR